MSEGRMSFHNRRAMEASEDALAVVDAELASRKVEASKSFPSSVAKALARLVECMQDKDKKSEKENTMSDNEFKTDTLRLTMTVLPSGSVTVESDKGESYTFLSDTRHGGATYFEDTGILRFAGAEHWERHEPRLRGKRLKDSDGDIWAYVDGKWKYEGAFGWYSDYSIEEFILDGFTIVDDED